MTDFEVKLARLKEALGLAEDQEVAAALGLSKATFSGRKKRDSFPEGKLYALAGSRPELRLDTAYVLTGVRAAASAPRPKAPASSQPFEDSPLAKMVRRMERRFETRGMPPDPRGRAALDRPGSEPRRAAGR